MRVLAPIVFVVAFGVCNRFFVRSPCVMSFFSKNFYMNDGFSSGRRFKIRSSHFCRFLV